MSIGNELTASYDGPDDPWEFCQNCGNENTMMQLKSSIQCEKCGYTIKICQHEWEDTTPGVEYTICMLCGAEKVERTH